MKIALIAVHGVSLIRRRYWAADWAVRIEDALGCKLAACYPITWDHLCPQQSHWFWRIAGDTGSLGNPAIHKHIDSRLQLRYARCLESGAVPLIVAHSLGALLAHQSLLRYPAPEVRFVTLGAPPRLRNVNGLEMRPGVAKWVNVYSLLDSIVLAGFLSGVRPAVPDAANYRVSCFHSANSYLNREGTAAALRDAAGV